MEIKRRKKEEEKRRVEEEFEMNRIRTNPRKYMEKTQRLTAENKNLKYNNTSLTQTIKKFERILVLQKEMRQKVKFYRDKFHNASKINNAMRKEIKQVDNLENIEITQVDVRTSQKCSDCEENRKLGEFVKEKFESMNEKYKIIRKFTHRRVTEKQSRKVYMVYRGIHIM